MTIKKELVPVRPADADLVRKFIPMLYNMFLLELAWILTVWKGKYHPLHQIGDLAWA
jgi:hypothetical protein